MSLLTAISTEPASRYTVPFDANVRGTQAYNIISNSDEDFENYMAATLDVNEPNGATWDEIKAKFGL